MTASGRAARRAAARRARSPIGTTPSSDPWISITGRSMARTALVALTERTVWPRGRRKTRVVNQASGQAIGAGMGSRARRNVWRVSRYGSAGVDAAITAVDVVVLRGRHQRARAAPSSGRARRSS